MMRREPGVGLWGGGTVVLCFWAGGDLGLAERGDYEDLFKPLSDRDSVSVHAD